MKQVKMDHCVLLLTLWTTCLINLYSSLKLKKKKRHYLLRFMAERLGGSLRKSLLFLLLSTAELFS